MRFLATKALHIRTIYIAVLFPPYPIQHNVNATRAVALNLFNAISHFATPNLNISPPLCNEFWHFVINTIAKCHNSTQHSRSPLTSLLDIMHKIQTNFSSAQSCQHCDSKKSRNFAKCSTYALPQAIGLPSHRINQLSGALSQFLSGVT